MQFQGVGFLKEMRGFDPVQVRQGPGVSETFPALKFAETIYELIKIIP